MSTILLSFALTCVIVAQAEPEYDMGKMQLVLLTRSSELPAEEVVDEVQKKHVATMETLVRDRKLPLWGKVEGKGPLREILVLKTESPDEAKQFLQTLPAVKAGILEPELVTWYAARNLITPPRMPLKETAYVFGILVRGPKWSPEVTDEVKRLQEQHLANINRLAEAGKLVLAGPFIGGETRRGVFIFKVDSLEEAQALTDTDPAVQAGRLKIELHRWRVYEGMLP